MGKSFRHKKKALNKAVNNRKDKGPGLEARKKHIERKRKRKTIKEAYRKEI